MTLNRLMRLVVLCAVLLLSVALMGCDGTEDSVTTEPTESSESQPEESTTNDEAVEEFTLLSDAFDDEGEIPVRFANTEVDGGENVSIPYTWSGVPDGTKSLLLLLVDRHEVANDWVHWVIADIPASTASLAEGSSAEGLPAGIELTNTNGVAGYSGPQPPPGSGDHPYEAMLYALDTDSLDVQDGASLGEIVAAAEVASLAEVNITGYFGR